MVLNPPALLIILEYLIYWSDKSSNFNFILIFIILDYLS